MRAAASAALLYPGGRTTHSMFKILQFMIKLSTSRTELIKQASHIIWDEAPMANRTVLTCVDNIYKELRTHEPSLSRCSWTLHSIATKCEIILHHV